MHGISLVHSSDADRDTVTIMIIAAHGWLRCVARSGIIKRKLQTHGAILIYLCNHGGGGITRCPLMRFYFSRARQALPHALLVGRKLQARSHVKRRYRMSTHCTVQSREAEQKFQLAACNAVGRSSGSRCVRAGCVMGRCREPCAWGVRITSAAAMMIARVANGQSSAECTNTTGVSG